MKERDRKEYERKTRRLKLAELERKIEHKEKRIRQMAKEINREIAKYEILRNRMAQKVEKFAA